MLLPMFAPLAPTRLPDAFGPRDIRAVRVLRLSITDRCNFRCVYCMPESGIDWLPKDSLLTFDEIAEVVRAAVDIHGIRRFKLTGGEPTVRRGLPELVARLRGIPGVEDLSLTTNGMRLAELARPLREAGLDRITVSVDSLRPDRFRQITRTGDLAAVLRGIENAELAGFDSLKINCVTMRGTNDDELVDFARLSLSQRLTVRFIEYMPLGESAILDDSLIAGEEIGPAAGCGAQDRGADALVPESEVRETIESALGPLDPIDRADEAGVGPAKVYRLRNGHARGRIGFISAMSAPFCATCNRLRLTADGVLRSCLFEGGSVDIRPSLRTLETQQQRREAIADLMMRCVALKPIEHSRHGNEQMSRIGG